MKMTVRNFANFVHAGKNKMQIGGVFAIYKGEAVADAEWDSEDGWAFYDHNNDFMDGIDYENIHDDTLLDIVQIGEFDG